MKTKLYKIDKGAESGFTEILMATFERWNDAETAAIFFADCKREDFLIREGKRSEIKRSYLFNLCPNCDAPWRYNEMAHRKANGTTRCDCGCLFEIDWTFQASAEGRRLSI